MAVGLAAIACTRPPTTTPAPAAASHLPPVPVVRGPLALRVVYPPADSWVNARDSSFLLGSTGAGDAELTINGAPVRVWPNGAWLAWLQLPPDSLMQFRLVARTPRDSAELVHIVHRVARFAPPAAPVWIDSTSLSPRGRVWLSPMEYLPLSARASEGAILQLRLSDGTVVPLEPDPRADEVPAGVRGFDQDTLNLPAPLRPDHYAGILRGRRLGGDAGPILPAEGQPLQAALPEGATSCKTGTACRETVPPVPPATKEPAPVLEAIHGPDTARVRWPLEIALVDTLPLVAELVPGQSRRGERIVVGRAAPRTSYHWFFPVGTRVVVTGRREDDVRIRLGDGVVAWVAAADVWPLPRGTPPPRAIVGSITISGLSPGQASVRIPLGDRIPFRVDEGDQRLAVTLYGASGDASWIRYRSADSVVRRVAWVQDLADRVTVNIELGGPLWGYQARWSGTDLVLDVRQPPRIDRGRPLEGRLIVVDPGHPPLGATGPTGLYEGDANLAVAQRLRAMLEAGGARVVMTRTTDTPVELGARVRLADSVGADLLVSIHNNALPDGLNPFTNNGTSVFYNQPRSLPLARAIQRALVRRLGLRDLGVGRGDLALARPTWMPAVLCEGLFMTLPDQEAALRTREGQELYAGGVYDGIVEFLKDGNGKR
jgi:N-acetylmuramoyl-L-alanine amidase